MFPPTLMEETVYSPLYILSSFAHRCLKKHLEEMHPFWLKLFLVISSSTDLSANFSNKEYNIFLNSSCQKFWKYPFVSVVLPYFRLKSLFAVHHLHWFQPTLLGIWRTSVKFINVVVLQVLFPWIVLHFSSIHYSPFHRTSRCISLVGQLIDCCPLSSNKSEFISGIPILFNWSMFLFLFQYYIVLIIVVCSIIWSLVGWFPQLCFSFSRLIWLFGVFCVSIQIDNFLF